MPKLADEVIVSDDNIVVDGVELPFYVDQYLVVSPPSFNDEGRMIEMGVVHVGIIAEQVTDVRDVKALSPIEFMPEDYRAFNRRWQREHADQLRRSEARVRELEDGLRNITSGIDHTPTRIFDAGDADRLYSFIQSTLSIIDDRADRLLSRDGVAE